MQVGLQNVNGNLYYFDENLMTLGQLHIGAITINGVNYYCNPEKGGVAERI